MAVALFGGSFLSASLQVLFDRVASRDFINLFRGKKRTEILLKKLKITLLTLNPVLDDAEYKQLTNPAVKDWLDELKDAIYRADDLVDEIATEAMRSKLISEDNKFKKITAPVSDLVSYSVLSLLDEDIASKIEGIIEILDYFVNAKDVLGLKEVVGPGPSPSHRLPTTSLVDQDSVYGRNDDKDKIIQMVLSDDDPNGHHISVIPIVGMGGIGKTTLAQLVYNDARVLAHNFDMKAWVCVSEKFDVVRVTKTILEAISEPCNTNELNQLQVNLEERLRGKKFLLFLDDVWNEKYNDWDILRNPFRVGARGSKIIVTTRNDGVASIMQTVPIQRLDPLSDEECWFLFSKHAFENGNPGVQEKLEAIGREIVEKCRGLPLAAKTMGGLLRSKVEIEDWENVLESEIWELPNDKSNILPALMLSYLHLPSYLKRCFAYCAIIPKDHEFEKEMMVRLWIAEGFVHQPRNNRSIKEMGADYFRELISRSLLQHSSGEKFVMHDLINDLAQFVSGEFCFRLEENKLLNIYKVRHYSLSTKGRSLQQVVVTNETKCLRTFLLLGYKYNSYPRMKVTLDLLSTARCLRVVSLHGYDIVELPDSFGDMIHLRYLDISSTPIKCLPESISRLCNLQTLLLRDCQNLTRLPTYLFKLICLRHLDISETRRFKEMPEQIGRLSSLQLLTRFIVGKNTWTMIGELRDLNALHGTLHISNLENVSDGRDAMEGNLRYKEQLEELILEWSDTNSDELDKFREVLDKLQPHVNLKKLTIENYIGTRFPDWVGHPSFLNIRLLYLYRCNYSSSLPPVGQLPSLKDLTIRGMNKLVNVGSEFYGDESIITPFPSLERLRFEDMPKWEEWYILGAGEFCHLQELTIIECPKLKGELPKHLPSLKKLDISGCTSLDIENILERPVSEGMEGVITTLKELSISPPKDMELHHHYKCLEDLYISRSCDSLESLPLSFFPKLRSLHVHVCRNLKSLPVIDSRLQNLAKITIWECEKLKALPEQMCTLLPSLQSLRMWNLPEIESFPEGGLPHSLSKLWISHCKKLMGNRREWGLRRLPSLQDLSVWGESEEEEKLLVDEYSSSSSSSFPEDEYLFPATLASLDIGGRQNMKTLNPNGLRHLHSLHSLYIQNCPKLQCLPDEGLPTTSLSLLFIYKCPMVKERCKRGIGQDWLKIAHIPHVEIVFEEP